MFNSVVKLFNWGISCKFKKCDFREHLKFALSVITRRLAGRVFQI